MYKRQRQYTVNVQRSVQYTLLLLYLMLVCVLFYSIGMCRMRRFLAVLRSFFHSSLSYVCVTVRNLSIKLHCTYVCYTNIMLHIAFGIICSFTYQWWVLERITRGYGGTTVIVFSCTMLFFVPSIL
jgi:hypothetical protein